MKIEKLYYLSGMVLCFIFLQSYVSAQNAALNSPGDSADTKIIENQISEENLIHFGDLIEIDVVGSIEYDWRGTVSPEGFLDGVEHLDEPVYGLCRSEREIEDKISASYARFLRNPKVAVKILDRSNRPNSIISGAIKTPQRLRILRPIYLNELLIISGGLTDKASGEIQIFRPHKLNCLQAVGEKTSSGVQNVEIRDKIAAAEDNGSQFIAIKINDLLTGKESANPRILSGDIITVLEAQPIYVIGGVENPGQISSRSEMTLTRAVASAGGLSRDSDEANITIFRREAGETTVIPANLEKIKARAAEDIVLRAFDVVEVARRGKRERTAVPILENFDPAAEDKFKLPLRIID